SSRRRHTRSKRDWSSDVCSSDLSGAGAVSNSVGAILKRLDPAHIDPHRGVELQRLTTGGGFRTAEEDADLLPQLVDEDRRGSGRSEERRVGKECNLLSAGSVEAR